MNNIKQLNKFKMALLVWCVIYPTVSAIFFILGNFLATIRPLLRTLIVTLILVPLMVFVYLPFINKRFGDWLRK
jgi:antibiotic biosynthesis monooxygenase (ABM) superfamily enzyme